MNRGTEVHISGSDLPDWATESTLRNLIREIEELQNLSERGRQQMREVARGVTKSSEKNVDALEENLSELVKETRNLGRVDGGATPEQRKFTAAKQMLASGTTKLAGGLDGLYSQYMDQARSLGIFGRAGLGASETLMELSESASKSSKILGGAFAASATLVGLFTSTLGMFYRIFESYLGVFRDMYDTGLTQVRTMSDLNYNLRELVMTSDQFNKIMTTYARTMGTYGQDSLARLVGRSSNLEKEFASMGLTVAEAAEFSAELLERQRLASIFGQLTEQQQRAAMLDNIENLTRFSQMLNVSRREIQAAQKQMLEDPAVRLLMMQLGERGQENLDQMTGWLRGMGVESEGIIRLMQRAASAAHPIMVLGELGPAFSTMPQAMDHFMNAIMAFRENRPTEEVMRHLRAMVFEMAERGADLSQILSYFPEEMRGTVASIAQLGTSMVELQSRNEKEINRLMREENLTRRQATERVMDAEMQRAQEATKAGVLFDNAMKGLRSSFEGAVVAFISALGGEGDEGLTKALGKFSNFMNGVSETLAGIINDLNAGKGFMAVLKDNIFTPFKHFLIGEGENQGFLHRVWSGLADVITIRIPSWSGTMADKLWNKLKEMTSGTVVGRMLFGGAEAAIQRSIDQTERGESLMGMPSAPRRRPERQQIRQGRRTFQAGIEYEGLRTEFGQLSEPLRENLQEDLFLALANPTWSQQQQAFNERLGALLTEKKQSGDLEAQSMIPALSAVIDELSKINRNTRPQPDN